MSKERWCGSNFDAKGNYRFKPTTTADPSTPTLAAADLSAVSTADLVLTDRKSGETFIADLGWGSSNFDDVYHAWGVCFQVCSVLPSE